MKVAALFIYPVKGMRACSVQEALVEPWGLAGDRRWVVVDQRGKAITQREHPELARISARPMPFGLTLAMNGQEELEVPFPAGPAEALRVFSDPAAGSRADPKASDWLTHALGEQVQLLHMGQPRSARPLAAPEARPGEAVSFADEYPVLLTSLASHAALNGELGEAPIGVERFRPNIVVEGAEPWAEQGWDAVRTGQVSFRAPSSCRRCVVITIDQTAGRIVTPGEPLKTLTRLNRGGVGHPLFGRNLIPDGLGTVRVGDVVEGIPSTSSTTEPVHG